MSLEDITFRSAGGPPPTTLSPDRPGNDPTTRSTTGTPQVSRPAESGVIVDPSTGKSVSDAQGNALTPIPKATGGTGLGVYFLGALAITAVADTVFAPVAVAFLVSAVIYNANPLLNRIVAKKGSK